MSKRQQHAPEFKAKVALEALKGEADGIRAGQPVRGSSDDDPSHGRERCWKVPPACSTGAANSRPRLTRSR